MTKLTKGQTVFYLNTNPIDIPTKEEPCVYEMIVREERGKLVADTKIGPFTTRIHSISPPKKLGTLVPRGIGGFVKRIC